ncbi:MAG: lipopolysaccharide transport periplasmic protein LptA [Deltaproteobacteria bacterium]|nr:lipopolysaccharide transport periplasmic protein LptA [Deltaproteobacteria bacterium]
MMSMTNSKFTSITRSVLFLGAVALAMGAAAPAKEEAKKGSTAFEFNKKDPIFITADWMEADQSKNSMVFKGRVVTVQNDMTMRSEVLTAFYDPETKQMKQIVAEVKVNATQGNRVATGEKAVFDDKSKTVTLTGNPVMRQGNSQISGTKVIYFTEQDRSIVEGEKNTRVTAVMFSDEFKGQEQPVGAKTK